MVDAGMNDSRARDESAARQEIFADAGEDVPESELLSLAGQLAVPKRRVARNPSRLVKAPRALKRGGVDIAEHEATIDIGDPIIVAAKHAIGVGDTDPR